MIIGIFIVSGKDGNVNNNYDIDEKKNDSIVMIKKWENRFDSNEYDNNIDKGDDHNDSNGHDDNNNKDYNNNNNSNSNKKMQ